MRFCTSENLAIDEDDCMTKAWDDPLSNLFNMLSKFNRKTNKDTMELLSICNRISCLILHFYF